MKQAPTKVYSFILTIAGKSRLTDAEGDALYEAGCDDGLIVSRNGVAYVRFAREAESLEGAINSAIRDVRKAGFDVGKVEIEVEDL